MFAYKVLHVKLYTSRLKENLLNKNSTISLQHSTPVHVYSFVRVGRIAICLVYAAVFCIYLVLG